MTQTWTDNDRDRIVKYLNLTREYDALIASKLTSYETDYGASAIAEVQSKLNGLDDYNDPNIPDIYQSPDDQWRYWNNQSISSIVLQHYQV
jgi:hypothetical protein